jgi:chromosome segregation ATPase
MSDEQVRLKAELDQAKAAVKELRKEHDAAEKKVHDVQTRRTKALKDFRAELDKAGEAFQPLSEEMERREGAVRVAEARLRGEEPGPTQGVGRG